MATSTRDHPVKLGFVEEDADLSLLKSHFFPSKVGGKPSWLSLYPIPCSGELQCLKCKGPCIFLMQVYAPLEMRDDTFHRTIFLFVCSNASCSVHGDSSSFRVFRSQLPLMNRFYSKDPPLQNVGDDSCNETGPNAKLFQTLCQVCGCSGTKKCSQCKKVYYCSKAHQVADWRAGHKKLCAEQDFDPNIGVSYSTGTLFKEFELVTEDEDFAALDSNNSKSEEECLQDFEKLMMLNQSICSSDTGDAKYTANDLEESATAETEDDKQFHKFKRRIDSEPTQVLRYNRGGEPLWISAFHKPASGDIPNCSCGAPRVLEFQVMPQLLNYLSVDQLDASLDWGTLCVYTCKESCSTGNQYREEFLWKQDFQSSGH